MLYCYAGLTEKLQDFIDGTDHIKDWPRNPGAKVFTESGQSYLEAMFNFTKKNAVEVSSQICGLLDRMLEKHPQMKDKFKGMPVSENPIIECWCEYVLAYMKQNLSVQDISNTAMRTEFNTAMAQVENEMNLFIQKRFKPDTIAENKPPKTKTRKRGRKKDPKVKRRNKAIVKYQARNPRMTYKEIGTYFDVSADTVRKACNNPEI
jgi:hypothetical protein